jgi:AraC-like DNA-binding protein
MPSSRAFAFDDPHPYQAAIRAAKVEITPTTKGHFHAELLQIDLHRLWMQRSRESLPQLCRGSIDADRAAIEFPVGAPGFRLNGLDVAPGEIVVHSWKSCHCLSLAPGHIGTMSLTPADLAATGRVLLGRDLTVPPVAQVVRPAPAHMTRLMSLHEQAAQLARTVPDILARPRLARGLEEALIHAMIRCLTGVTISVDSAARYHTAAISKFEEFLAENCDQPIYLSEICTAISVSESTLRRCCHERLGMGPVRYLWLRRMHLARAALMRPYPATGNVTVTGIATDYGFWELGRFSVEYRKLFGESPSATLRRPPDDRRTIQNRPFNLPVTDSA